MSERQDRHSADYQVGPFTRSWRQVTNVTASDFPSQLQTRPVQQADSRPVTKAAVLEQMRHSLMIDPYWQRKRDSRKGSLLQKGLSAFPETANLANAGTSTAVGYSDTYSRKGSLLQKSLSAFPEAAAPTSTGRSHVMTYSESICSKGSLLQGSLSAIPDRATLEKTGKSTAAAYPDASQAVRHNSQAAAMTSTQSQFAFGEGSIAALRMPDSKTGSSPITWSGDTRHSAGAPEEPIAGRHDSRQGSVVRFALQGGRASFTPRYTNDAGEGAQGGLPAKGLPGDPVAWPDTLEAGILLQRSGSQLLAGHVNLPNTAPMLSDAGANGAAPQVLPVQQIPNGQAASSEGAQPGDAPPASHEASARAAADGAGASQAGERGHSEHIPAPMDASVQPQTELEQPPVQQCDLPRLTIMKQNPEMGAPPIAGPSNDTAEPQVPDTQPVGDPAASNGEADDWKEQQQKWLQMSSGLAETAGLQIRSKGEAIIDELVPVSKADLQLASEDGRPSLGARHAQTQKPSRAVSQRQRLEESLARAMRVQVERWGVKEVCDWAEYAGLGQYRKRFLHHCIGGALLLELTEENLKVDLAIPSLGHRRGLLRAIHDLRQHSAAQAADGIHQGSAPGSPASVASPNMQAAGAAFQEIPEVSSAIVWEQQRDRLMKHLSRAQTRAALRRVAEQQAERSRILADEDVSRIKGQLVHLSSLHHVDDTAQLLTSSPKHDAHHNGIDRAGSVPWQPAGAAPRPMSSGGLGSEWASQELAQRALSGGRSSRPGTAGSGRGRPCSVFLDRLEIDLEERKRRLKEKQKQRNVWSSPTCSTDGSRQGVREDAVSLANFSASRPDTAHLAQSFAALAKRPQALSIFADDIYQPCSYGNASGAQIGSIADDAQDMNTEGSGAEADAVASSWQHHLMGDMEELADKFHLLLKLPMAQVSAMKEGPLGTRLRRLAACVHSAAFMQRYRSDMDTREARRAELACRWIREELYQDKAPAGRLARFHKPLQTPEQRRSADVAAARGHFCALGWARAEVEADDVDRQLDSLIARAHAMQEHEKRLDNMAEHQRAYQPLPNFSADGLDALQQQANGSPPKGAHAVAGSLRGAGASPLQESVQLLTACRSEDLQKLEQLTGPKKVLAVFRMLRCQSFVRNAEADLQKRNEKAAAALSALQPQAPRQLTPAEAQAFYDRLIEDSEHRRLNREQLREEAEQAALKRQKEAQDHLKRVHAMSAARRAKAAAHAKGKGAG